MQSVFYGPSRLPTVLCSRNTHRFVVNLLIQCFQEFVTAPTVNLLSFHMTSAHTMAEGNLIIKDVGGSYVEDTTLN